MTITHITMAINTQIDIVIMTIDLIVKRLSDFDWVSISNISLGVNAFEYERESLNEEEIVFVNGSEFEKKAVPVNDKCKCD